MLNFSNTQTQIHTHIHPKTLSLSGPLALFQAVPAAFDARKEFTLKDFNFAPGGLLGARAALAPAVDPTVPAVPSSPSSPSSPLSPSLPSVPSMPSIPSVPSVLAAAPSSPVEAVAAVAPWRSFPAFFARVMGPYLAARFLLLPLTAASVAALAPHLAPHLASGLAPGLASMGLGAFAAPAVCFKYAFVNMVSVQTLTSLEGGVAGSLPRLRTCVIFLCLIDPPFAT